MKSWKKVAMGSYLLLIMVFLPLSSILRSLQLYEPGQTRNLILPLLLLLFLLAFNPKKVLKPRTYLHYFLILIFFQAAIVGIINLDDGSELRSYLSHLFQIMSAYIMLGVGWEAINTFSYKFWKRWTMLSLIAVSISTALTLTALGKGDIGRLYTPVFAIIFVMSFSALQSKKMTLLSYATLIVSNKRGPMLAVILLHFFSSFTTLWKGKSPKSFLTNIIKITVTGILILVLAWSTVKWAEDIPPGESAIATAINITYKRVSVLIDDNGSDKTIDELSSGRVVEMTAALNSAQWWSWIVGSGAGWGVDIGRENPVHNIHFSPLSLTMVFGLPFAVFLYLIVIYKLIKYSSRSFKINNLPITAKMAPFYVVGGVIHSLIAYSLFIDLLFFFFVGVLFKSLTDKRVRNAI